MNFLTEIWQTFFEEGKKVLFLFYNETETEKLGEWHFTSLNESNYINYSNIFSIFNHIAYFLRDIKIKMAVLGAEMVLQISFNNSWIPKVPQHTGGNYWSKFSLAFSHIWTKPLVAWVTEIQPSRDVLV